jgi:hypothetical protein
LTTNFTLHFCPLANDLSSPIAWPLLHPQARLVRRRIGAVERHAQGSNVSWFASRAANSTLSTHLGSDMVCPSSWDCKDIPMTRSCSVSEDSILQTANHHRSDSPGLGCCPGSIELVLPHLHCGILHSKSCDKPQTPVPRILDSGEVQQYALAE